MHTTSLLDYVRQHIIVDVDSMNPQVAARDTTETVKFCDMTSNQAIVFNEAADPSRYHVVQSACKHAKSNGGDLDQQVTDALDILTVLLAKQVFPFLTGRVHAQTSPRLAYDTDGTVAHAQKLVALFEANDIPKSRVCIKIPTTPESIIACQILEARGIRTLATCLFSLPQALAASQAKCLYIAPYFNELRVHFEAGVWKEYESTETQHPMISVIRSIMKVFRAIGSDTLVMPASIVTLKEVSALLSAHPDHITPSGAVLEQLAAKLVDVPNFVPQPPGSELVGLDEDLSFLDLAKIDFLAEGTAELRKTLDEDAEATRKLADALKIFGEMEEKTKGLVRTKLLVE